MKNYKAITSAYLSSNGLTRIKTQDAATGELRLRQVTVGQLEKIKRTGRKFDRVG